MRGSVALLLSLGLFLTNSAYGMIEYGLQKWSDRNVVDSLWLAQNDRNVVDAFKPQSAYATQVVIDGTANTTDTTSNNASPTLVWISDTEGFAFYTDAGADIQMASTSNGGASWNNFTTVDSINTIDAIRVAVWYDRWTPGDTTGNLIHIATLDTDTDDTYYTQYNTVTDVMSTTVLTETETATSMTAALNSVGITKAEDGTLYITSIEAGDGWAHACSSGCTNGANWSPITSPHSSLGDDHVSLLPIAGTDNIMLLTWDISVNDIESRIYSATSTSWWAFNTGINQGEAEETTYDSAMMGSTINRSTGEIYLAYVADNGTEYTVEDHDIDIWEFNNSTFAWTQKTASALANMGGGITGVKIAVDETTGDLYLAYLRRTTIGTIGTTNVYWRTSSDDGETWGAEQGPLNSAADDIRGLSLNIMSNERIGAIWKYVTTVVDQDGLYHETVVDLTPPGAPTVSTDAASSVDEDSATLNGTISDTGGENASDRGFAWGTNSTLSNGDTATTTDPGSHGTGGFTYAASSLSPETTYYFRAYATNSSGTSYGSSILNFTTSAAPEPTVSRAVRLFEGFRIRLAEGRMIIYPAE